MSEQDYSKFTLQELYDHYRKIDNDIEPEKAKNLFSEIEKRERETSAPFESKLAPRGLRLLAFAIDIGIIWVISTFSFRFLYGAIFTIDFRRLFSSGGMEYLQFMYFILACFTILVYFLVNANYLKKNGQSVGKKIIGLKIIDSKENVPPLSKTYMIRFFIPAVIATYPILGWLIWIVDAAFIFGSKRKCLHDYIADTKVVYSGREYYF
ncbi:MAG TPA: RDD family protein [Ignavibacteriaceae bacterium]|nr:RDD family protein [Ignavibacteriaceae bacterium]